MIKDFFSKLLKQNQIHVKKARESTITKMLGCKKDQDVSLKKEKIKMK